MTARQRSVALALLSLAGRGHLGAATTALPPASVQLEVRWGARAGPEAFRSHLQRALAECLATRCFASVLSMDTPQAAPESDLILALVLSDSVEQLRFDDSIAGALQPGEPAQGLRRVAYCTVTIDAVLSARVSGAPIGHKHFTVNEARRPMVLGEDPQAEVRSQAIASAVRTLSRSFGCGGKKLERKISEALSGREPAPPRAR